MRLPIAKSIVTAEFGALPCAYQVNNSVEKRKPAKYDCEAFPKGRNRGFFSKQY
jgi:hypothetical protein